MAERADEYQNKSFLSQTNKRSNEATYGGSTLPKNGVEFSQILTYITLAFSNIRCVLCLVGIEGWI